MAKAMKGNKVAEVLALIGAGFADHMGKYVPEQQQVSDAALDFMEWLRAELGGQLVYFPKGVLIDKDATFSEIYDKHLQGAAVHELVREFNLSTAQIYRVLAQVRNQRRMERDVAEQDRRARSFDRWKREGGNGDGV